MTLWVGDVIGAAAGRSWGQSVLNSATGQSGGASPQRCQLSCVAVCDMVDRPGEFCRRPQDSDRVVVVFVVSG